MKPVHVHAPVFNRHDLLEKLFASLAASTVRPDRVYIVDHAYDSSKILAVAPALDGIPLEIVTLDDPGGAHASNWFLRNIPEERIGCGDDVQFEPDAIAALIATPGDFVIPNPTLNPMACCLIRDSCVKAVGYYDEEISPNYIYFDDTDFIRRLDLAGLKQTTCHAARVIHENGGSQTLAKLTPAQMEEHHRRFRIASANYSWKWGGPPFHETLTEPRSWPRPDGWGIEP